MKKLILVSMLVALACIAPTVTTADAQAPILDSEQSAFLGLINNYRSQNGAGPLQVSVALQNSSQWMSTDMATKNYFSHTDSLGRDPFTRMAAFGYRYSPAGENIAAGTSSAQQTFTLWQTACDADASGACTYAHRQNMLNASYKVIGIGRAYYGSSSYGWYWTTDFGGVVDQTINTGTTPITPPVTPPVIPQGPPPIITSVISAGAFGAFTSVAIGSWIEIYGYNLASQPRSWAGTDFSGINAPTSLDGTSVTIGGQRAFIDYISPTQVNAQVPSGGTGPQEMVVNTSSGFSSPYTVTVSANKPGLLALPIFSGDKQYVTALFSNGTYAFPPGGRRVQSGDVITLYGIGFGGVTPSIPPGQIVQQSNALASPFHLFFGQAEATVLYAGLAPDAVGLYQFNVVVPNISPSDTIPLTFTLEGIPGTQTLCIAVQ